jgi:hypothetical protein
MQQLLNALSEIGLHDGPFRQANLRANVEGLVGKFFPELSSSPLVKGILEFLFSGKSLDSLPTEGLEAVFLSHIAEIKNHALPGDVPPVQKFVLDTPQGEDVIVSQVDKWDALKLINYLLLQSIPASKEYAIVATARDEGLSILEWIAYHRVLGFEAFFIYTNDNTDGSSGLLETLASHKVITLIRNQVAGTVSPQQKCYEHSLYFLPQLRAYRWVSYLDIDEFILPLNSESVSLSSIFDRLKAKNFRDPVSSVYFNWKWFGSGGQYEMKEGFVLERFHEARSDPHGKSISKLSDVVSMRPVHYPTLFPGCQLVDSEFKTVTEIATHRPTYESGQINHYWNKSFQEFALKKVRGLPSQGVAGKQREFQQFFAWDARAGKVAVEELPAPLVERVREEYRSLLALPGIGEQIAEIKRSTKEKIQQLETKYGLRGIFEKGGAM